MMNQPIIVYRTCGAPLHAPDPPNDPALEGPWSSTRNHFTLRDNRNWLFCALFAVEMLTGDPNAYLGQGVWWVVSSKG